MTSELCYPYGIQVNIKTMPSSNATIFALLGFSFYAFPLLKVATDPSYLGIINERTELQVQCCYAPPLFVSFNF